MKRLIILIIIAVLFSFGAKAQLSADSVWSKPKFIGVEYILIDTFTQASSGNIDTLMHQEFMNRKDLIDIFDSIPPTITPNNDTIYKKIDIYRLDYLYSLKIVRYQKIKKFVRIRQLKARNIQMSDLVRKRYKLDYDIDLFWEHAKVKELTDE